MKKKIFILAIFGILIAIITLTTNAMERKNNMEEKLLLKIKINKAKYKLGDNFETTYMLQNISNKPLRILPWRFEYATNILNIYDEKKQKDIEKRRLVIYELRFIPQKEDFILILPNHTYTKTFNGIIKRENVSKVDQNSNAEDRKNLDLVIDFNDSVFLLDKSNTKYIISAIFKSDSDAIEKGKKLYNLADVDVWEGTIKSNKISFVINEL